MEENITLNELESIVTAMREREYRHHRFLASIQGIDIDEGNNKSTIEFDDVKRRVEARKAGKSEEELAFGELGIAVVHED